MPSGTPNVTSAGETETTRAKVENRTFGDVNIMKRFGPSFFHLLSRDVASSSDEIMFAFLLRGYGPELGAFVAKQFRLKLSKKAMEKIIQFNRALSLAEEGICRS